MENLFDTRQLGHTSTLLVPQFTVKPFIYFLDTLGIFGHFGVQHTSYISRDRTITEQEERRKLVIELKEKIASDSAKRWVIKYGKVLAVGEFIQS